MEEIISLANELKYNSLEYVDSEEIVSSKVCIQAVDNIFLYKKLDDVSPTYWNSKSKHNVQIYWASESEESFFQGLHETVGYIKENEVNTEKIYIEFIPEDFLETMNKKGFVVVSEWVDFWIKDLSGVNIKINNNVNIREANASEVSSVAAVTRSCAGCSRGFTGENDEFIKEWYEDENSCVFVAEINDRIAGVCLVSLYGFESEKGTVLWIREMAVRPEYQGRGIGKEMLAYAIKWGIENGAKRSFLACDAENLNAVKLYESFNYERREGSGQINMELVIM